VFQHTAARRRLHFSILGMWSITHCFNTQPHEGGCFHPVHFPMQSY